MAKYRQNITMYTATEISESESLKDKDEEFITTEEYCDILDDIESDVKKMSYILNGIEGLDIIDDIKTILDKMEEELY
jgi:hypothetical protein